MAIWKRFGASKADSQGSQSSLEAGTVKSVADAAVLEIPASAVVSGSEHGELQRGLKARHISMIAIGGAIGTGLIIGT